MFEIHITETATSRPADIDGYRAFNTEVIKCGTVEEVHKALRDRYGKDMLPVSRRTDNGVYVDTPKGVKRVGFTYSYWNRDCSHNSKSWYQRDWICVDSVNREPYYPILVKGA